MTARTRWRLRTVVAGTVAATCAALSLSACSSGSSNGVTTLTLWDPGLLGHTVNGQQSKSSFIYNAVTRYEKTHPKVKIDITETSSDITASSNQFRAASLAHNGPDLRVGFTGGNTLSYKPFLEPLNHVFTPAERAQIKGWQTVTAGYSDNGKILALPYGAGSYFLIFYNKKMMAKAGVDMSKPPATWQDMLALGRKVKAAGENPFWVTNQEGYVGAWVIAALVGAELGPKAFTDMYSHKTSIDSPAMVKAYQAFANLYKSGLTNPDAGSVGNGENLSGFVQGKGAMYFSGGWDNHDVYKAMGNNVGAFPIPPLAGSAHPNIMAGGPNIAVSVTAYSSHQAQANDFLKFLAKPSTLDLYVKLAQTEPSNNIHANPAIITNPLLRAQAQMV
ncbi:MAG: carbohydrate ABC transporter substrate-binding protein, partial [Mycobacterium sp.]|nr:carbohydrate ABC transporter substrate-binding protein [Mycobacterium sp.]